MDNNAAMATIERAVARQAGARAAEGYALTAPGSSLGDLRDVRDSYRGNPRGQAPAGALLSRKTRRPDHGNTAVLPYCRDISTS